MSPAGLQEAIDSLVKKHKKARSFVRPSGTEDVVRVYAEAETQVSVSNTVYYLVLGFFPVTTDELLFFFLFFFLGEC